MSLAAAAFAAALLALAPPFRREDADVRAGNAALAAGDAEEALRRYARAEAALGERPEILYDRGTAALRLGRLGEAAELLQRAADRADPGLASRALQNLGNARAATGDEGGAAAALRASLRKDPANEDARYDLEVLLRRVAGGRGSPAATREVDPPSPPAQRSEAGGEGRGEGGRAERGQDRSDRPLTLALSPADAGERGRGAPTPTRTDPGGAVRKDHPRDRQEAEALLDALRARERTLPAFGAERQRERRADAAKDW